MEKYKLTVHASFTYGGWKVSFKKNFTFSHPVFYGLMIIDTSGGGEFIINLKESEYQRVEFYSYQPDDILHVDVEYNWLKNHNISSSVIEEKISLFTCAGWIRTDNTDIAKFKELINRVT